MSIHTKLQKNQTLQKTFIKQFLTLKRVNASIVLFCYPMPLLLLKISPFFHVFCLEIIILYLVVRIFIPSFIAFLTFKWRHKHSFISLFHVACLLHRKRQHHVLNTKLKFQVLIHSSSSWLTWQPHSILSMVSLVPTGCKNPANFLRKI